jgi:nitroreductase
MLNDLSSPAAFVATRRSGKPRDMAAPGPDAAQLERILTAAMRVPDHGKIAPWRIVVIDDDARDMFAALLERAYRADKPEPGRLELDSIEQFARQAPTLVAVLSVADPASKIPVWEQELSAGALCMNLLAADETFGMRGGWLTGWAAFSPVVAAGLGFPLARIAGFLFIGSAAREPEERPRPAYEAIVSHWKG